MPAASFSSPWEPPRLRWAAAVVGLATVLGLPAQAQPIRMLAFGDSITRGTGDDEGEAMGYPVRLQGLLLGSGLDVVVENHGLGGERTPEGLTRLDEVLAGGGDVLLLMEGSNDISRSIGRETTVFNLREMGRKAEQQGFETVHATVIPRIPRALIDSENVLNQRLNEEIRHLAGTQRRRLVDNFEVFWTLPGRFEVYYWDQPTDFVGHPNPDGYDIMAGVFFDVLTDVDSVPPVTGLLMPWNGADEVDAGAPVTVEIWDFGTGVDTEATTLLFDEVPVTTTQSGGSGRLLLTHTPEAPLSGVVEMRLQTQDLSTPPHTVDREIGLFVIKGTTFLEGDLDRDGSVDGGDLARLGRAFGFSTGDPRFDRAADLDGDGTVDGVDLARLAANFGRSL